jgi:Cyclic nucleotide-binding domain
MFAGRAAPKRRGGATGQRSGIVSTAVRPTRLCADPPVHVAMTMRSPPSPAADMPPHGSGQQCALEQTSPMDASCHRRRFSDNAAVPGNGKAVMATKVRKFDPKAFLGKADGGVTVAKYKKDQVVFVQGDPADSIFYIQEGKIKVSVVSAQGQGGGRCIPQSRGLHRRGLPDRTAAARFDCQGHDRLRDYPSGQGHYGADAPRRAEILRTIHNASLSSDHPS